MAWSSWGSGARGGAGGGGGCDLEEEEDGVEGGGGGGGLAKRARRVSRSWTVGRRGSLGQVWRAARADLRRAFFGGEDDVSYVRSFSFSFSFFWAEYLPLW